MRLDGRTAIITGAATGPLTDVSDGFASGCVECFECSGGPHLVASWPHDQEGSLRKSANDGFIPAINREPGRLAGEPTVR